MTFDEFIRAIDYETFDAIQAMPAAARQEVERIWDGGKTHPDVAAELVSERFKLDLPTLRDKVLADRAERRAKTGRRVRKKPVQGSELLNKAEIIAAMDCLVHHMYDVSALRRWTRDALPDSYDWRVLDASDGRAEMRTDGYARIAEQMTPAQFEVVCATFAELVASRCLRRQYCIGAFTVLETGTDRKEKKCRGTHEEGGSAARSRMSRASGSAGRTRS